MTVKQVRFEALRNAIYNTSRKRFLSGVNRFFSFIVIIAGAAAMGDLGKFWGFRGDCDLCCNCSIGL